MIQIRDLSFSYQPDRPVVQDITLDLLPGERVAILGPNGSGKSTFLKCVAGLLTPTSGSVAADADPGVASRNAGLVFQNPDDQIVSPVVESEIAFGLENIGVPRDEMIVRVNAVLERFDLTRYRHHDPHLLSGGERQRLAIASIVVMRPEYLLLDEPFSMLDPAFQVELRDLIAGLKADGITPVVVCQDPDEALGADRLLVFNRGAIIHDGLPAHTLSHPDRLRPIQLATTCAGRVGEAVGLPSPVPVTPDALIQAAGSFGRISVTTPPTRPVSPKKIVEISDLRYTYNPGLPTEHVALRGIDLTIRRGEVACLMGPSGSGKSTLALHLNGLNIATAGTVSVGGLDAGNPASHEQLRRQVGLVFQFPESQLFAETLSEDVGYGPRNLGMDNIPERIDDALESVGLDPPRFRERNPFTLSGGEKRRAALAGVLATSPSLLVLDEPMAGLDPAGTNELDTIITELNASGVTILMMTHDLCRAAALSDRIIGMNHGRVALNAPVGEAFSEPDQLRALGLPLPRGIVLVDRLREVGLTIPDRIITSDQLAAQLR